MLLTILKAALHCYAGKIKSTYFKTTFGDLFNNGILTLTTASGAVRQVHIPKQ